MEDMFKKDKIKWFLLMIIFGMIAIFLNQSTQYQSTYRSFFRETTGIYIQMMDVAFSILFSIFFTIALYFIAKIFYRIIIFILSDAKDFINVINPQKESLLDFIEFAPVDKDGNMIPIKNKKLS
ncbi:MAG: hypothetical protein CR982_07410 [Candidatus Cloacimonadota bacterium]|nr:MAG: hypothetical protein CR982_07410 [Candidatus Cloacimonadota bacterium]PIE80160.1 MAG: hypothetical protein CSA15_02055 [Candidatus Delongbacteria bacterium]